jgi:predicted esterase
LFADGKGGFAGLCGFCSWLPLAGRVASAIRKRDPQDQLAAVQQLYLGVNSEQESLPSPKLNLTPILLEHSRDDEVISVENGVQMRDMLGQLGFRSVEWHEYEDGGHWINEPQGVDNLVDFLRRVMSNLV